MLPIILVHGIARFDIVAEMMRRLSPRLRTLDSFQYFNGISSHLVHHGFENIFSPNLDFAGPSALRAAQLKTAIDFYLDRTDSRGVHIIAHSMGGLDSRRMIVDLQMEYKVKSLTTIGTPHLGTVLADYFINHGGDELSRGVQKFIRLDLNGGNDLTLASCSDFNRRLEDREAKNQVFYQTYSSFEARDRIFGPLRPSHNYIFPIQGPNDGLVPVSSQSWTDCLTAQDGEQKSVRQNIFPFPADHLNETGWWDWEERDGMFELANSFAEKREYEDKVKALYLEIAEYVTAM